MGKHHQVFAVGTMMSLAVLSFLFLTGMVSWEGGASNLRMTGNVVSDNLDVPSSFARCLTEQGVRVYGSENSESFKAQKSLFGKSFEEIEYINCDTNSEECSQLVTIPTWIIDGSEYHGSFSLDIISRITGCKL